MSHEQFMQRAIELSRIGMQRGDGGPFGAVVVCDGKIVGEGWNHVLSTFDPTTHAEVVAIRNACQSLKTYDLRECTLYSSAEPCPMCLGASYWARLKRMYYGNSRQDTADIGFDDAQLYKQFAMPITHQAMSCSQLLRDEANTIFQQWSAQQQAETPSEP